MRMGKSQRGMCIGLQFGVRKGSTEAVENSLVCNILHTKQSSVMFVTARRSHAVLGCDSERSSSMGRFVVRAVILPAAMALVSLFSDCGSGLPHSSQVTVTVTPAQATVTPGGTLDFVGNASGFTETPIVRWWIQEARNTGGDDCGYLQQPPTSPCQFGYVIYGSVSVFPSSASYFAPLTPGTYHVTFEATQFSTFDHLSKTASATISVTP